MALTNCPNDEASVYRYFNANNVGYNLLDAILKAATNTRTFSRMRDQNDAQHLADCISRAIDNAAARVLADQHALLGDPTINWDAN